MIYYIAFGSQTGNAESIASQIHADLSGIGVSVAVPVSINTLLDQGVLLRPADGPVGLIVVCSTCGDGDLPDNASKIRRWAKKLSPNALQHVSFTVLALGSTDYSNFCQAGRSVRDTLTKFGARLFFEHGEADDATSLETVVKPWTGALVAYFVGSVNSQSDPANPTDAPQHDEQNPVVATESSVSPTTKQDEPLPQHPLILYGSASADATLIAALLQTLLLELKLSEDPHLWPIVKADTCPFANADLLVLVAPTDQDIRTFGASSRLQQWAKDSLRVAFAGHVNAGDELTSAAVSWGLRPIGAFTPPIGQNTRDLIMSILCYVANAQTYEKRVLIEVAVDSAMMGHARPPSETTVERPQVAESPLTWLTPTVVLHTSENTIASNIASEMKVAAPGFGISLCVADIHNYKLVGFPRSATFLFVLGDGESVALQALSAAVKRAVHDFEGTVQADHISRGPFTSVKFGILSLSQTGRHHQALALEHYLLAGGATKIHPTGLADSRHQGGIDTVLVPWQNAIWRAVLTPQACDPGSYVDASQHQQQLSNLPFVALPSVSVIPSMVNACPVAVLYANGGRAQATATFVAHEATSLGFQVRCHKIHSLRDVAQQRYAILVGDPPRSSSRTVLAPDALFRLSFAPLELERTDDHHGRALWPVERHGALQVYGHCRISGLGQLDGVVRPWVRSALGRFTQVAAENADLGEVVSSHPVLILHAGGTLSTLIAREGWKTLLSNRQSARVSNASDFDRMGIMSSRALIVVIYSGAEPPTDLARLLRYISSYAPGALPFRGLLLSILCVSRSDNPPAWSSTTAWLGTRLRSLGAEALVSDVHVSESCPNFREYIDEWLGNLVAALGSYTPTSLRPLTAQPVAQSGCVERFVVLYGSSDAHGIASSICASSTTRGYIGVCAALDDYERVEWRNCVALIIVLGTELDGAFPADAISFGKYLRHRGHPPDVLSGLRYAVLALGDSSEGPFRFCACGKYTDRRLEELGAMRFYARMDADVRAGFNTVVEPWINNLWAAVELVRGPQNPPLAPQHLTPQPSTEQVSTETSHEDGDVPFTGRLKSWSLIANDPFRPVILVTFEVNGITWSPGDAVRITPTNRETDCDNLCRRLGVDPREPFLPPADAAVAAAPIYRRLVFPICVRDVLLRHVCLRVRNANILNVMLSHTSDPSGKEVVKRWLSAGPEWRQILRDRTYVGELLDQVPSCRPSFRDLVEALMPLQSRSYSLCSAWSCDPRAMSICFRKVRRGVCTHWLHRLCTAHSEGAVVELRMSLRRGAEFELPDDIAVPLILVGPGTGVAPFISFLQHRRCVASALSRPCGETHLFFGCRKEGLDFIFKDEMAAFQKDSVLHGLHVAFSQEPADGVWYGGCYVQDKLIECSIHLADLIVNQGAYIYVCGDADSMAHDVHNILLDAIEEYSKGTRAGAAGLLDELQAAGRYQRDIWS